MPTVFTDEMQRVLLVAHQHHKAVLHELAVSTESKV